MVKAYQNTVGKIQGVLIGDTGSDYLKWVQLHEWWLDLQAWTKQAVIYRQNKNSSGVRCSCLRWEGKACSFPRCRALQAGQHPWGMEVHERWCQWPFMCYWAPLSVSSFSLSQPLHALLISDSVYFGSWVNQKYLSPRMIMLRA